MKDKKTFRMTYLAADLRYIADCMTKLEEILNLPNCMDCAKMGACEIEPEWDENVRFNCPEYDGGESE